MAGRNPYLILGIDYGASPKEARRQFAKAARRIRRAEHANVRIEDLNWALHEVETNQADPFDQVETFRVPADPAVFEPGGEGLFQPPAVPLPRQGQATPEAVGALEVQALAELGALLELAAARLITFDIGYQKMEAPAT